MTGPSVNLPITSPNPIIEREKKRIQEELTGGGRLFVFDSISECGLLLTGLLGLSMAFKNKISKDEEEEEEVCWWVDVRWLVVGASLTSRKGDLVGASSGGLPVAPRVSNCVGLDVLYV